MAKKGSKLDDVSRAKRTRGGRLNFRGVDRRRRATRPPDADEAEFADAVRRYQTVYGRGPGLGLSTSWAEVLEILESLGYRKLDRANDEGATIGTATEFREAMVGHEFETGIPNEKEVLDALESLGYQKHEISGIGKGTVGGIAEMLDGDDLVLRRSAVQRLTFYVNDPRIVVALPALKKALRDPDSYLRWFSSLILQAAAHRERHAAQILVEGLEDPNQSVRSIAAAAIRGMTEWRSTITGPLQRLLKSTDENVRAETKAVLRAICGEKTLAEALKKIEDESALDLLKRPEDMLRPAESVETELAAAVTRLIFPKFPDAPEAKAKAIISLERTLNQTFRKTLQGQAEPLIKSLLQDIPADYDGKRDLAILINSLFAALDFGILIHDRNGHPRICSMQATRARPTDEKGQLRLCARSISNSSQRSFSLPPLDQLQIVETPREQTEQQVNSAETTRTI